MHLFTGKCSLVKRIAFRIGALTSSRLSFLASRPPKEGPGNDNASWGALLRYEVDEQEHGDGKIVKAGTGKLALQKTSKTPSGSGYVKCNQLGGNNNIFMNGLLFPF